MIQGEHDSNIKKIPIPFGFTGAAIITFLSVKNVEWNLPIAQYILPHRDIQPGKNGLRNAFKENKFQIR